MFPTVPQQFPQWTFETGVEIRTSYRFMFMVALLVVFTLTGVLVFHRIHILEKRNEMLQFQLDSIHTTLNEILLRVSESNQSLGNVNSDEEVDEELLEPSSRRRRSVNGTEIMDSGALLSNDSLISKIRNARKIRERERGKRSKLREQITKLRLKLKLAHSRRRAAIADFSTTSLSSRTCGSYFYFLDLHAENNFTIYYIYLRYLIS